MGFHPANSGFRVRSRYATDRQTDIGHHFIMLPHTDVGGIINRRKNIKRHEYRHGVPPVVESRSRRWAWTSCREQEKTQRDLLLKLLVKTTELQFPQLIDYRNDVKTSRANSKTINVPDNLS